MQQTIQEHAAFTTRTDHILREVVPYAFRCVLFNIKARLIPFPINKKKVNVFFPSTRKGPFLPPLPFGLWTAPNNRKIYIISPAVGLGCGLSNLKRFLPSTGSYTSCCTQTPFGGAAVLLSSKEVPAIWQCVALSDKGNVFFCFKEAQKWKGLSILNTNPKQPLSRLTAAHPPGLLQSWSFAHLRVVVSEGKLRWEPATRWFD